MQVRAILASLALLFVAATAFASGPRTRVCVENRTLYGLNVYWGAHQGGAPQRLGHVRANRTRTFALPRNADYGVLLAWREAARGLGPLVSPPTSFSHAPAWEWRLSNAPTSAIALAPSTRCSRVA